MSPDMNPPEHVWDFIGRKINQCNPKCQNIDELRTAILQEWQQFPQERLRRLVRSMTEAGQIGPKPNRPKVKSALVKSAQNQISPKSNRPQSNRP